MRVGSHNAVVRHKITCQSLLTDT